MRALVIAAGLAAALAPGFASAQVSLAQVERLPSTSRAERQLIENNRALDLQQQQRGFSQQNQFEVNQLRNQLQQQQMFPPPGRACPTGAVAC
ncbi:MAG TPA: hypothetical protein VF601_20455 [Beijerinckiaceae bacterium]|jgi:hypothetical protein